MYPTPNQRLWRGSYSPPNPPGDKCQTERSGDNNRNHTDSATSGGDRFNS
ncbi:hypothetical protein CKA32_004921 [Geitlerinema sp. FC II]|nr:hypothetical protein CKA32_004921 [Geitlerinema sp. FC II]